MHNPDYLFLENISKTYPVKSGSFPGKPLSLRAVHSVSLNIKKNETVGLVGESGCGKSTLGKIGCGLESPTSGRIVVKGAEIDSPKQLLKSNSIQMIFQDPFSSLNPRQKISSIIAEPLKIHKAGTRDQIKDRTLEISSRVGLSPEQLSRYPHEFSGGQRQRVAIARAMILNPGLVICDEPVSALDVSVQAQILKLLKNLQHVLGLSYLFISHDLSVVKYLCARVAVMYLGELVEISDRNSLFAQPGHPYTRALISAVPVPDPARKTMPLRLDSEPPDPMRPPTGCFFHPRCPEKMDICSSRSPAWTDLSSKHRVRCFLYE